MTGTIHEPGVSQDEMADLSERVALLEERTDTAEDVGPAGADGVDGKDAIQPRFTVGSVTMGDQPSVSISGDPAAPVLDFVMPRPANGEDGSDGTDGIDGVNGSTPSFTIGQVIEGTASNVTLTGTQLEPVLNFVLKSGKDGKTPADGKDGLNGKSAYQSWLGLGNSGTEQQFIESLKALPGKDGVDGTNGTDGSSPTFGIGTVTQGAQASASLSGTALNPTLNLVLPRGPSGISKRIETYTRTTNAQGQIAVVYPTPFTEVPSVQTPPPASANQVWTLTASTLSGFTAVLSQRNAVTLLGLEVLLGATVSVANAAAQIVVIER